VALDREDASTAIQRYHLCAVRAQTAALVRAEGLAYLGLASSAVLQNDAASAATMLAQARERFRRCDPLLERYAASRLLMWNPSGTPAAPSLAALNVIWRGEPEWSALPPAESAMVKILFAWAQEESADLQADDAPDTHAPVPATPIAHNPVPDNVRSPANRRRVMRLAIRWHHARGRRELAETLARSLPALPPSVPVSASLVDPAAESALG
jgi:hypothetical protein